MNQKVICNRAHICEVADGCDHSFPHEVETFEGRYEEEATKCTDWDECEDHKVRCMPYGIDFEIEGLFTL